MELREEFVTFEIAVALKNQYFGEPTWCVYGDLRYKHLYSDDTSKMFRWWDSATNATFENYYNDEHACAPLWQQVIYWFAKQHQIFIELPKLRWVDSGYGIQVKQYNKHLVLCNAAKYTKADTYEKAREQGVLKAIEVLKKRNKNLLNGKIY
jgi:hypothetical protein